MLSTAKATPTLAVKDLSKAKEFYEKKLGLKPLQADEEVQIYQAGNTNIEVYKSEYAGSNKATAMTWEVSGNLDKEVQELKDKGITFEHYEFPEGRLEGDIHVIGNMRVAWFKDPDGNILCIHEQ